MPRRRSASSGWRWSWRRRRSTGATRRSARCWPTSNGRVLAKASNKQVTRNDPTAHAEITLIRVAARTLGRSTFEGLHVATNAEPCSMCLSALVKSRVAAITYGAPHEPHIDPPLPAEEIVSRSHHRIELLRGGILADECAAQIANAREVNPAPPD